MVARLALVIAVMSLGVACGGGGAQGAFDPASMPQGGDWTGTYFSDWGTLELQRTGDTVVGSFRSDIKHGRLSGSVNGNVLRFSWSQIDDRIVGRSRTIEGSGQFQYTVDDNGEHHLAGTWGYGADISGAGVWNASKSRTRRRPRVETEGSGSEEGDTGSESGGEEQTGETGGGDTGGEGEAPDALDDL